MKPSIPKGTRDFLPADVVRRKYLFSEIEDVFRRFGYLPIETPSMEDLQTLTGKYGEEGDRLLFKVLNNGDFLAKADEEALTRRDSNALVPSIARRGMRYDLTVPFARYVVMHRNEIQLPFKRYQIQPVWRADRPQKGRYQEFYQCDADVVGSQSLLYEAELVQIYDAVFHKLGLPVRIRLNHRKILAGIAEICGIPDKLTSMTIAIDKIDKIGIDGVRSELLSRDIGAEATENILKTISIASLEELQTLLDSSEDGRIGCREMQQIFTYTGQSALHNSCVFDVQLARGLDYYTGCIFEVDALDADMGSLGGGGRYDDLTGVFGMPDLPGVGISFGAERIFDVMVNQDLFPADLALAPQILFVSFDQESLHYSFKLASTLRAQGIAADIYPEPAKMKKQMKYADSLGVPFVAIIGEEELRNRSVMLKNMKTGEQSLVSEDSLLHKLQAL